MTTQYTPLSNIPYPQPSDPADLPRQLQWLAESLDGRTVLRFGTATERDTKIPAPVAGMVAWVASPPRLTHYTGSAWTPVGAAPVFRNNSTTGTTGSVSYTETLTGATGDPMAASFTAPGSGQVIVTVGCFASSSSAGATSYMGAVIRNASNTVVQAASDVRAVQTTDTTRASLSTQFLVTGLAPGTNCTATLAYRSTVTANTATFGNRYIRVDPIM
ncbi:hypothetical protein [Streptomyces cyaneofuscatus]|uniref:Uncharacterized protein n=1 Tax=Streptomyces cyaneofuscatus TaxID=66883 RepID=A0ABZ1F0A3_9ACTN|nr:hypothetical protein [Streptomyces cyaneofuscatus]WSB09703.1 hypothetical protein OG849_21955 [Streptomyces cyaneofuscatus]WSD46763.1 hypothetical protein OG857_13450 [Streptomyces cyaneofuscatus]